jgi:hypothetical protein
LCKKTLVDLARVAAFDGPAPDIIVFPELVKKWRRDPAYKTALALAQLLCEAPEKLPETTRSANFFTRLGEKPEWARGRYPVAVIKDHAFYRIPADSGARRAW